MSWNIQNTTNYQILENEELKELKTFLTQNHINCPVTIKHCNTDFWFNNKGPDTRQIGQTEFAGATGRTGFTGVTGPTGPTGRGCVSSTSTEEENYRKQFNPVLDSRMTEINIQFSTLQEFVDQYKNIKFNLSTNRDNECYQMWLVSSSYDTISITKGIYKTSQFDEAFAMIRLSNPNLTDQELYYMCSKLSLNLFEHKLYCGEEGCLVTYKEDKQVNENKVYMTFKILLCDLKNNLPTIKNILKSVKY